MNKDKCPLCKRELGNHWNKHHVKPKTFGGKDTIDIHAICHNKIHSVFTERELTQITFDQVLGNEHIIKFIKWISKKDIDFYQRTKQTKTRRR